ncbi:uncharacterized protein [Lepeophtheirus salmonis]|uniref:uncharacterized protein isoform X2 n=1 Tax=Lepeophtheirus salmonis TaxID=72036 RepID=UPI001AE604C7|nr:uncharacterized protein LOC121130241 isoform X2 [Lepeophtheirus salmonis]XP_040581932.1 uncharacterized protein LOC121130241 isoform X2 [Lepeophtheirus salmonis]XP_040581933.1 uncharacterized protein LOC121130241 isoform X2 [Lepeophtheirus salmonis]XP_040581934.1 uncharacterized protein LOC121130241 isoform X2 [Lepeophtheirus salmonis]XP_040581935.1 uncharacterized protein LOC121130241 isoform X2 [Lepeophtheirus salmonis]XP_040581937.1 uncharacterized protein LOC121130241 isoform X2 [Lepeop
MGSTASSFLHRDKALSLPSDLHELLEEPSSNYWLPKFRYYLQNLDDKNKQSWRITTLDFILKLRQILEYDKLESSQKFMNEKLQNIVNERNQLIGELYSEFLKSDCLHPIAMSSAFNRERLLALCRDIMNKGAPRLFNEKFDDELEKRRRLYTILNEALNDFSVWQKMEKLYEKYIRTNPSPSGALAVLLSIL